MAGRSPARFLAPLALVAFVVALLMILQAGGDDQSGEEPATNSSKPAATATASPKKKRKRRVYVVKPGDTPSGIAEKTGVPLSQILELNPDLDDQTLTVGDKIRLRK
jgi:LysM repeat protein